MRILVAAAVIAAAMIASARADEPMDLGRSGSRWVEVQVVTSAPGETPRVLSPPARAWLRARPDSRLRTVTIPGRAVERRFFGARRPVQGSFSDFVWVFDADTGHVLSASLSGRVNEPVRLGLLDTSVQVALSARLSSASPGGYGPARVLAGRAMLPWCADPARAGCTPVSGAAYDPATGWVKALGPVCARWRAMRTRAFSALGHARFRERSQRSASAEVSPVVHGHRGDAPQGGAQC